MSAPSDKNVQRVEQLVDQALRKEPAFKLSVGFADRVLMQLEARRAQADARDWIWLGLGLLGFVIAAVVGIILSGFSPSLGALTFLSNHGSLLVFGIVFIVILQWIDRRFVRKNAAAV
jgi:hypothetical protein